MDSQTSHAHQHFGDDVAAAEKLRLMTTFAESIPSLIAYYDQDVICQFANRSLLKRFPHLRGNAIGVHMREILGKDAFEKNKPFVFEALNGKAQTFNRALKKPNGGWSYILASYAPDFDDEGAVRGFFVLATDVTELREAQMNLEWSAQVLDSSPSAIVATDEMGTILRVNPHFCRLIDVTPDEALHSSIDVIGADPKIPLFGKLLSHVSDAGTWKGPLLLKTKSGRSFPATAVVTIAMSPHDADIARVVLVFDDASAEIAREQELLRQASHDPLTDLPNRALLDKQLKRMARHSDVFGATMAAMFVDLNGFKKINDSLGHHVGDQILCHAAATIQSCVRKMDFVARVGGDEFVVLLDGPIDHDAAAQIAERILSSMAVPADFGGQKLALKASIGIALRDPGDSSIDTLMSRADGAMYSAKRAGNNTYHFEQPDLAA